jgi:peptidylprolyl isomerase
MRRSLAAVPLAALVLSTTTACGDDGGGNAATATDSIDGLTVSGKFGSEPKVEVDGLDVSQAETGTIISGDGEEVAEDDSIRFRFYAADATNGQVIASNFSDAQPSKLALGTPGPFNEYIVGTNIGDRVAVALPVKDLVEEGQQPPPGLKRKDDLVLVFDVIEQVAPPLDGPEGEPVDPPAGAPAVVEEDGDVTGIDFTGAPAKPPKKLQVIPLIEGDGAEVVEGDQLTVDYYGVVWGEKEPFDQSYSRGEPTEFGLAQGQLIDGWVEGLAGVTVGSRVMLVVPPEQGYGKQGSPPAIPGGATLVFVIDVLGANL